MALAMLLAGNPASAAADGPTLRLPLDCTPGTDCWIAAYVDHDPTDGLRDYMCGRATYNEPPVNRHQGIDFAIEDLAVMRRGVAVLAAAAGTVAGVRDGVDDGSVRTAGVEAVKGRECGNGVRIDHGGGWSTQYCHLRKGSVAVRAGQTVAGGETLGLVGLSGMTEYPHVHFQVASGRTIIDPFVGEVRESGCGLGAGEMWSADTLAALPYGPTVIYAAGFAGEAPDAEIMRDGGYRNPDLPRDAPAFVFWFEAFHVRKGDTVDIAIVGPDGHEFFANTSTIAKDQQRKFAFAGRKRDADRQVTREVVPGLAHTEREQGSSWPGGTYRGTVTLTPAPGGERRDPVTVTRTVKVR